MTADVDTHDGPDKTVGLAESANAILAWTLVGTVTLTAVAGFLTEGFLWGGFSLFVAVVTSVPALLTRDWKTILPWPLLGFAAVGLVAGTTGSYPEAAGYLTLVTLALIVVVNLDVFTSVELS